MMESWATGSLATRGKPPIGITTSVRGLHLYTAYGAMLALLCSRLLMLTSILLKDRILQKNSGVGFWNTHPSWYHSLLRWDSGWYLEITKNGYSYDGRDFIQHPVVFYPLYPLISRLVSGLFGIHSDLAVLAVSNGSLLIAIPLAFALLRQDYSEEVAFYSLAFLSFFPTSLFFSAGYTESLIFLLIIGFFLLLRREHYLLAAACAGLATATRSTGIVLVLPLLWELWMRFHNERQKLVLYSIGYSALATSGLWLYVAYLWIAFNSPFAFVTAQRAWLKGNEVGTSLTGVVRLQPFWRLGRVLWDGVHPDTLEPWFFVLFLVLLGIFGSKLPVIYKLYAWGVLLLPYLTLSGSLGFRSFSRYVILAFPAFIVMGKLLERRPWAGWATLALFAAMLFVNTAMFAQWHWAG